MLVYPGENQYETLTIELSGRYSNEFSQNTAEDKKT
jgi:hypothetical protein